jgi:hypothetical protein
MGDFPRVNSLMMSCMNSENVCGEMNGSLLKKALLSTSSSSSSANATSSNNKKRKKVGDDEAMLARGIMQSLQELNQIGRSELATLVEFNNMIRLQALIHAQTALQDEKALKAIIDELATAKK